MEKNNIDNEEQGKVGPDIHGSTVQLSTDSMLKNSPSNDRFYPSLATLVNVDGLPDGLDFIEGLTSDVIGGIFYRNLYITGNTNNDGSLYEMELITYNRMEVKLPAIGCSLVVNPSDADGTGSFFALHCSYSIGILRYIRQFSLSSFDWSGRAFFNLVTSIVNEESDALFKGDDIYILR